MRQRPTPRTPTTGPTILQTECGTKGPHHWRLPFPTRSGMLVQAMADGGILAALLVSPESASVEQANEVWEWAGAAIGMCWHHASVDLDTRQVPGQPSREFGAAVLQELWDAGYTVADLSATLPILFRAIMASLVDRKEVEAVRDFSLAPGVATAS